MSPWGIDTQNFKFSPVWEREGQNYAGNCCLSQVLPNVDGWIFDRSNEESFCVNVSLFMPFSAQQPPFLVDKIKKFSRKSRNFPRKIKKFPPVKLHVPREDDVDGAGMGEVSDGAFPSAMFLLEVMGRSGETSSELGNIWPQFIRCFTLNTQLEITEHQLQIMIASADYLYVNIAPGVQQPRQGVYPDVTTCRFEH